MTVVRILLGSHHRLIVIAQIGEHTLLTARTIIDANALPMPQQSFMKIVNRLSIIGQQGLQEVMGSVRRHLLADEAQPNAHPPHMRINW